MGTFLTDIPHPDSFSTFTYWYARANVNVWVDAGSPTSGNWKIIIDPGITITSVDPSLPALKTSTLQNWPGWLWIVNNGDIRGAGGNGGTGLAQTAGKGGATHNSPGGGGAGLTFGLKGETDNGIQAVNGTATAGGAGGLGSTLTAHDHPPIGAEPGGHAISVRDFNVIIENYGTIWGGGGGGAFADGNAYYGGAGGDPGEPGHRDALGYVPAGNAGYAVYMEGPAIIGSYAFRGNTGSADIKGPLS